MNIQHTTARILGIMLIATLGLTPEIMWATPSQQNSQQNTQSAAPQTPSTQPPDNNPASDQSTQTSPQASSTSDQSQQQTTPQTKTPSRGTTVDPSQAPLQPVTTYPGASTPEQDQQPNVARPAQDARSQQLDQSQQPRKPIAEPVGAAAAAKVATTGGAAARPAGVAIAPAKQHQTRSLLIKIGAIAAAGVAAGTVYGLSRKTSPTPPNTGTAGAVRK